MKLILRLFPSSDLVIIVVYLAGGISPQFDFKVLVCIEV